MATYIYAKKLKNYLDINLKI